MNYPGFCGPSNVSQSPIADQERTVNFYAEKSESPGATTEWSLYPTPGFRSLAGPDIEAPALAHEFYAGREFAVIGAILYEIGQFGAVTNRGTVVLGTNPATISYNGSGGGELFITAGDSGYTFNLATNVFAAIAFLAGKATMGAYLDGYFMALDASNSTLYISDLLDGTTWDPTNFAQRSQAPDGWVSLKVNSKFIWLFGSETSEVWYDAGTFPIPFAPHPSGFVRYGCAAPFSPENVGDAVCWVAATKTGNGAVLSASGFSPEVISTIAVDLSISGFTTISDAIGDAYDDLGHTFYVLTFPAVDRTWCYDQTTKQWHERSSVDSSFGGDIADPHAWYASFHAFAFGEHRVLDRRNGFIYAMSSDYVLDVNDVPIRRLRRAPGLALENKRIFYGSFELDIEVGIAGASETIGGTITTTSQLFGQVNPQAMLRMSNDGGKTWGPEIWRPIGKLGEYKTRVRWNRCGMARRRVFEVSFWSYNQVRILGAFLELVNAPAELKSA